MIPRIKDSKCNLEIPMSTSEFRNFKLAGQDQAVKRGRGVVLIYTRFARKIQQQTVDFAR